MTINALLIQLAVIAALIIIQVISAVALAIQKNEFQFSRLVDFLRTKVVPYLLVWGTLAFGTWAIQKYIPGFNVDILKWILGFVQTFYGIIILALTGAIVLNFTELGIKTDVVVKLK